MARGRQAEAWEHTSFLCCVIANHAFGAKRARKPAEFNPLRRAGREKATRKLSRKASMDLLSRL